MMFQKQVDLILYRLHLLQALIVGYFLAIFQLWCEKVGRA